MKVTLELTPELTARVEAVAKRRRKTRAEAVILCFRMGLVEAES
jgi:predicted transcriptional regulator